MLMKITVHIYYSGEEDNARKFAYEMEFSGIADRVRSEAGNLKYQYFFPIDDPKTVLLIDSWESQQALDAHHASPMMQEIMQLRDKYQLHMQAERFLSDENGIPASDRQFMKN